VDKSKGFVIPMEDSGSSPDDRIHIIRNLVIGNYFERFAFGDPQPFRTMEPSQFKPPNPPYQSLP